MAENPHCKERLLLLNDCEIEYLIAVGFAVMRYGEPSYTRISTYGCTIRRKILRGWLEGFGSSALPWSVMESLRKHSPVSNSSVRLNRSGARGYPDRNHRSPVS